MPSIDVAAAAHKARHATGGPDPITPADIGALPATDDRLKDTGWRYISTSTINGWTGTIIARRVGPVVSIQINGLTASAATSRNALQLPEGFSTQPVGAPVRPVLHRASTPVVFRRCAVDVMQRLVVSDYVTADVLYGEAMWSTTSAWPATLPGTPSP